MTVHDRDVDIVDTLVDDQKDDRFDSVGRPASFERFLQCWKALSVQKDSRLYTSCHVLDELRILWINKYKKQ